MRKLNFLSSALLTLIFFSAPLLAQTGDDPDGPDVSPMPCDVGIADFTITDDEVNQSANVTIDFPAAVKPGKKSLWILPEIGAVKKKSLKITNLTCTTLQCSGVISFAKFEKADRKIGIEHGGGIAQLHDKKGFHSKAICTMVIHGPGQNDDEPEWDHNDKLFCDWVPYDAEGFPLPPEQTTEDSPELRVTLEPGKGISTVTAYNFDPDQALKGCAIQPDGQFKEIWSVNIYDLNALGGTSLRSGGSLNDLVYGPYLTSAAWSEFNVQDFLNKNPDMDVDLKAASYGGGALGRVGTLVSLGSYGGGKTYSSGTSSSSSNAQNAAKFTAKRKKVIKRQAKKRKKRKKKKKNRSFRYNRFDIEEVSVAGNNLQGIKKFQAPFVFSTEMSGFAGDTDRLESAGSLNTEDPCFNQPADCDPCALDPMYCNPDGPMGPGALPKDFIYVFYRSCPARLKPNEDPFKVLRKALGDQFCSPDQPADGTSKCEPFVFDVANVPQGIDPLSLFGDVCKNKFDFGSDGSFVDTDIFIGGLPEGENYEICFDGRKLNSRVQTKLDPEYLDAPPGLAAIVTDNEDGIPDFDPQHFHTFIYDTDSATVNTVSVVRQGGYCSVDAVASVDIGQLEEE